MILFVTDKELGITIDKPALYYFVIVDSGKLTYREQKIKIDEIISAINGCSFGDRYKLVSLEKMLCL